MKWNSPQIQKKSQPISRSVEIRGSKTFYSTDWSWQRAMTEAMDRVTWVYRCVDAIASNASRLPIGWKRDDPLTGEDVTQPTLRTIFNSKSNQSENSFVFRYRLSAQLLLSTNGVFMEVVRSRSGDVIEVFLLDPSNVNPIESDDPRFLVDGYEVTTIDAHGRKNVRTLDADSVVWIRRPHPFNPLAAQTPLTSAGLAIETDWLAKLYNRNFLINDGRPGGIVVIKGEMLQEDKAELQAKFGGGVGKAGRISVIATEDGADFVDTAVTPRDAQYSQTRESTKDEILIAFGVPESVLGDAAQRTFDNAEIERLIFWQETMIPHMELIMRAIDVLDSDDNIYASYDLSRVDVLQRMEMKRREFLMREYDAGLRTVSEYRVNTGATEVPGGYGDILWIPKTKIPAAMVDGGEFPELYVEGTSPPGRPAVDNTNPVPDNEPRVREDERLPSLDNTPTTPAGQAGLRQFDQKMDYKEALKKWSADSSDSMYRLLGRLERVLSEKINGPAFKKKAFKEKVGADDLVDSLLNTKSWSRQIEEDLIPVVDTVFSASYIKTCKVLGVEPDEDVEIWSRGAFVEKAADLIGSTVESVVRSWRSSGDPDSLSASELFEMVKTEVNSQEFKSLVDNICDSMAVFAISAGVSQACERADFKRRWVGLGESYLNSQLDGEVVGPGQKFMTTDGTALNHPYSMSHMAIVVPHEPAQVL